MKNLKKAVAILLTLIMMTSSLSLFSFAAKEIDPSLGFSQKAEVTCYQFLDMAVSAILKCLNFFMPGLNWGDRWDKTDDYKTDLFFAGDEVFSNEVQPQARWSAGYASGSLLDGLDVFDGTYFMAGTLEPFKGRVPTKILDDQGVCAYALSDGVSGTVVHAVLDGYGLCRGDVLAIRGRLMDFARQHNIKSISFSVLHQHSGIDILGMAAPLVPAVFKNPAMSLIGADSDKFIGGKNSSFMENLYNVTESVIKEAVKDMKQGSLYYGKVDVSDYIYDKRSPKVFDPNLSRLRFVPDNESASEIWICEAGIHCVSLGVSTTVISSDFPYYLKQAVKQRVNANVVYVQGAELAITTNGDKIVTDPNEEYSFTKEFGKALADKLMEIDNQINLEPKLNIAFRETVLPVDNQILTLAAREGLMNSVITKDGLGYNIITEVGYMELGGRVGVVFAPGEIAPELIFGGVTEKDKSWTGKEWSYKPVTETADVENLICFGLSNDQIGYILADNDFRSIFTENEEVNASSSRAGSTVVESLEKLITSVKG